jgi:hypothetical protein
MKKVRMGLKVEEADSLFNLHPSNRTWISLPTLQVEPPSSVTVLHADVIHDGADHNKLSGYSYDVNGLDWLSVVDFSVRFREKSLLRRYHRKPA